MRLLYKIITGLIVALGCLHLGFTPFNYSPFDMEAMWFLGTGVAIILAGFDRTARGTSISYTAQTRSGVKATPTAFWMLSWAE